MWEQFIFNPIEAAVSYLLTHNQYGVRKKRSTLDAINQVVGKEKKAISGVPWKRESKKLRLLAALDVRNSINSARRKNICLPLDRLEIQTYLKKMIKSYLENRLLLYDTEGPNTTKSLRETTRLGARTSPVSSCTMICSRSSCHHEPR